MNTNKRKKEQQLYREKKSLEKASLSQKSSEIKYCNHERTKKDTIKKEHLTAKKELLVSKSMIAEIKYSEELEANLRKSPRK